MKKKITVFCAVFAVLSVICAFLVFAASEGKEASVVFDTVGGLPGETVEMKVHLTKNPGTTGLRFKVEYDESKMTLEKAEYTKLGGGGLTAVKTENNPFVIMWNVATKEFTETGVLATLSFRISEGASVGEIPIKVKYSRGDCIDFDLKNLDMSITEGKVMVLYDGTNCKHENTERKTVSEPSCTELGVYEVRCKACSTLVEQGNISYLEHSWSSAFVVKKEPTYRDDGYMQRSCGRCGYAEIKIIEKYEQSTEESVFTAESNTSSEDSSKETAGTTDIALTTENPSTGDGTWVVLFLAADSLLLCIIALIKRKK